jgi:hypothetical protein
VNHRRYLAWITVLAASLLTTPVWAHGDEDHSAPAAASAAMIGTEHVVAGETGMFSVVVKYPAKKGGGPIKARVYVARADTSAPMVDATVRLELKGGVTLEGEATKTDAAGVYELAFPSPPDGVSANGLVSVQAKDEFDLVLIGDLAFGPLESGAVRAADRHREVPLWMIAVAAGVLASLTGALGFTIGRRSRRRADPTNAGPDDRPRLSEVTS